MGVRNCDPSCSEGRCCCVEYYGFKKKKKKKKLSPVIPLNGLCLKVPVSFLVYIAIDYRHKRICATARGHNPCGLMRRVDGRSNLPSLFLFLFLSISISLSFPLSPSGLEARTGNRTAWSLTACDSFPKAPVVVREWVSVATAGCVLGFYLSTLHGAGNCDGGRRCGQGLGRGKGHALKSGRGSNKRALIGRWLERG